MGDLETFLFKHSTKFKVLRWFIYIGVPVYYTYRYEGFGMMGIIGAFFTSVIVVNLIRFIYLIYRSIKKLILKPLNRTNYMQNKAKVKVKSNVKAVKIDTLLETQQQSMLNYSKKQVGTIGVSSETNAQGAFIVLDKDYINKMKEAISKGIVKRDAESRTSLYIPGTCNTKKQ